MPFYAGKLKKLGGMGGKVEQTRWFELRGKELVYYADPPRGTISLRDTEVDKGSKDESFVITGAHLAHPYHMVAGSAEERAQWLEVLRGSLTGPDEGELLERLQTLELEREALFATSEQLGKEIQEKNRTLSAMTDQYNAAKDALKASKDKADEWKRKHSALADEFASMEKGREEDVAGLRQKLDLKETAHKEELQARAARLSSSETAAAAHAAKIASLEDTVSTLSAKNRKLNERDEKKEKKLAELTAQIEEMTAAHEQEAAAARAKLEAAVAQNKEEMMRITQHAENDRARLERIAELNNAQHGEAVAALEAALAEKDADRKAQKKLAEKAEAQYAEQTAELEAAVAQQQKLDTQLDFALEREKCVRVLAAPLDTDGAECGELYSIVGVQGAIVRREEDTKSEFISMLPRGAAVRVAELKERRGRITAPVSGWVSVETAAGVPIITKAQPWFSESEAEAGSAPEAVGDAAPYNVGECVEVAVQRDGFLAGWVSGRVIGATQESVQGAEEAASPASVVDEDAPPPPRQLNLSIALHTTKRALALGCTGTMEKVSLSTVRRPEPDSVQWMVYDAPDAARKASSTAFRHRPGFGCHKGRLLSDFAWMGSIYDTAPWYQVRLNAVQEVAGVCVAGYAGKGMVAHYPTTFSVWVRCDAEGEEENDEEPPHPTAPKPAPETPEEVGTETPMGSATEGSGAAGASSSKFGNFFANRSMNKSLTSMPETPVQPARQPSQGCESGTPAGTPASAELAPAPAPEADVATPLVDEPKKKRTMPTGWREVLAVMEHVGPEAAVLHFPEPVLATSVRFALDEWTGETPVLKAGVVVNAENYPELDPELCKPGALKYDDPKENVWLRTTETNLAMLRIQDKYDAVSLLQQSIMENRLAQETAFRKEKEEWDETQLRLMDMNSTLTQNILSLKESGEVDEKRTVVLDTAAYPSWEAVGARLDGALITSILPPKLLGDIAADVISSVGFGASPTKRAPMLLEAGMRIAEVGGHLVHGVEQIAQLYNTSVDNGDADVVLTVFERKTSEVVTKLRKDCQTLRGDLYKSSQHILVLEEECTKAKQELVMSKTSGAAQLGVSAARTSVDEVVL